MDWNDLIEQDYRRQEWLQAAEQRRLVARARGTRLRTMRFYQPVLVGLGRRLVAWGWILQVRGGGLIEASSALVAVEVPCEPC